MGTIPWDYGLVFPKYFTLLNSHLPPNSLGPWGIHVSFFNPIKISYITFFFFFFFFLFFFFFGVYCSPPPPPQFTAMTMKCKHRRGVVRGYTICVLLSYIPAFILILVHNVSDNIHWSFGQMVFGLEVFSNLHVISFICPDRNIWFLCVKKIDYTLFKTSENMGEPFSGKSFNKQRLLNHYSHTCKCL